MKSLYDDIAEQPLRTLTKREIRVRIAKQVGISPPYTHFGKRDMNSIYAYLNGRHFFDKRDLGTPRSPSEETVRVALADSIPLENYYPPGTPGTPGARPYRKNELIEMCETVELSVDQR